MTTRRLVLLSDTHCHDDSLLHPELEEALRNCDLIIHAGDMVSFAMYERLKGIAPLVAARGNMDDRRLQQALPELATTEVLGHAIAAVHGWGPPSGIPERIVKRHRPRGYAMVVYGHSHYPDITGLEGMLFVNPGSPVDRRFAPYNSFATLEVTEAGVGAPTIVKL